MQNGFFDLQNKRILITGASRGLGQVCATAFANEGARLLLTARAEDRLEKIRKELIRSEEHRTYAGDLTLPAEIEKLIWVAEDFGEIDVVIHVMGGGLGMRNPLLSRDEFDTLFKTNVASAAEINRFLIPGMIDRKAGNIVHVGSLAGREAVASVGYNTVKAGLAAYIRSLGRELASTGVIITGLSPGGFWAPDNAWVRFKERDSKLLGQVVAERQPRGRLADAEEIIPMLLFLASHQATMMTGCCVPIDGGEGITYS